MYELIEFYRFSRLICLILIVNGVIDRCAVDAPIEYYCDPNSKLIYEYIREQSHTDYLNAIFSFSNRRKEWGLLYKNVTDVCIKDE